MPSLQHCPSLRFLILSTLLSIVLISARRQAEGAMELNAIWPTAWVPKPTLSVLPATLLVPVNCEGRSFHAGGRSFVSLARSGSVWCQERPSRPSREHREASLERSAEEPGLQRNASQTIRREAVVTTKPSLPPLAGLPSLSKSGNSRCKDGRREGEGGSQKESRVQGKGRKERIKAGVLGEQTGLTSNHARHKGPAASARSRRGRGREGADEKSPARQCRGQGTPHPRQGLGLETQPSSATSGGGDGREEEEEAGAASRLCSRGALGPGVEPSAAALEGKATSHSEAGAA